MAEDTVEQRLQASIAIIREEMATKADFEVAIATAVAGLGTKDDLAQLRRDIEAEFVGIARIGDIVGLLQRLVDRVEALENPSPQAE